MMTALAASWGKLSSKAKIVTALSGAVAGVAGMIVAVPPAWDAMDLPEVASRHWVNEHVHKPMKLAQSQTQHQVMELQLDLARGKLDTLDNQRATFEIEKLKSDDATVKAKADMQIRKIDRDSSALSDQIKTITETMTKQEAPKP